MNLEDERMNLGGELNDKSKVEVTRDNLANAIRDKINDLFSRMDGPVASQHFRMLIGGQVRDAANSLGLNVGDTLGLEQQEIVDQEAGDSKGDLSNSERLDELINKLVESFLGPQE